MRRRFALWAYGRLLRLYPPLGGVIYQTVAQRVLAQYGQAVYAQVGMEAARAIVAEHQFHVARLAQSN